MGAVYATIDDVTLLGRKLTAEEQEQAETLLEIASAKLRVVAGKYGANIDNMIAADPDIGLVVKETVVKAVVRAINATESSSAAPAVQSTESALGYSQTMTFLNAGQSLYFLNNELKELGIRRQRYGFREVYRRDAERDNSATNSQGTDGN